MVTVVVEIRLQEGKLEQAKDLFEENGRLTEKIPGFVSRKILFSRTDPLKVVTIHTWRDDEAMDAWSISPEHIWDVFGQGSRLPPGSKYVSSYLATYGENDSIHAQMPTAEYYDDVMPS